MSSCGIEEHSKEFNHQELELKHLRSCLISIWSVGNNTVFFYKVANITVIVNIECY